ncbi:unnamed protein product [Meganyctiphanes norvegica]|uniref:Uncharacterized protein n=1 Tax=Meganyctiphanes norvegica TaxID=48144 RepID=A0AAV2RYI2_MEGNR
MDQLEVLPVSMRVVCLNAPHLKSLCVFEALSRQLGCYYNHHRPQIVESSSEVNLPVPRIVRIRGHATQLHPSGTTPVLHTTLKMGTYLVFHLSDWSQVRRCHLVLNGIEPVPRKKIPPRVYLERVTDTNQGNENDSGSSTSTPKQRNNRTRFGSGKYVSNGTLFDHPLFNNAANSNNEENSNSPDCNNSTSTWPRRSSMVQPELILEKDTSDKNTTTHTWEKDTGGNNTHKSESTSAQRLSVNLSLAEEVTSLMEDDKDDDVSDASDDIPQVVRRCLSVDVMPLLAGGSPPDNLLVLLLRPAQEEQAWQFLSAHIVVHQQCRKDSLLDGPSTPTTTKKTLTRTKPLYFSKNGTVSRI